MPLDEIDFEDLRQVLGQKNFDLIVHLPFRQPLATEVEEFNEAVINYLERLLEELKSEIKVEKAVVHVNLRDQDSEVEKQKLEQQVERLKEVGDRQEVEICFENMGQYDGLELFELGELLDSLDASMCFDNGHALAETGEEEMLEFLEEFSHLISHIHFQDTREGRDLHLPIGSSEVDFEPLADRLQDFDGTACLEIFTGDSDYMELSKQKFLEHFDS